MIMDFATELAKTEHEITDDIFECMGLDHLEGEYTIMAQHTFANDNAVIGIRITKTYVLNTEDIITTMFNRMMS
jgi:hypothetical protein